MTNHTATPWTSRIPGSDLEDIVAVWDAEGNYVATFHSSGARTAGLCAVNNFDGLVAALENCAEWLLELSDYIETPGLDIENGEAYRAARAALAKAKRDETRLQQRDLDEETL